MNSPMLKGYTAGLDTGLWYNVDAGPIQFGAVPVRCWARISGKFWHPYYLRHQPWNKLGTDQCNVLIDAFIFCARNMMQFHAVYISSIVQRATRQLCMAARRGQVLFSHSTRLTQANETTVYRKGMVVSSRYRVSQKFCISEVASS